MVIMMYRIVTQLIDIPSTILVPNISPKGNSITVLVPYAQTLVYQESFPDTIRVWNSHPQQAFSSDNIDSFRSGLAAHHTIRPQTPPLFLNVVWSQAKFLVVARACVGTRIHRSVSTFIGRRICCLLHYFDIFSFTLCFPLYLFHTLFDFWLYIHSNRQANCHDVDPEISRLVSQR